jgi:lipoprotein NlpD
MRILLLTVLLAGCTSTLVDYESRSYVVQPGDTLYTIAWRHGVDHRELARWNGLANPDVIYVGQRLTTRPGGGASVASTGVSTRPRAPAVPNEPAPTWVWPTRGPIVSAYGHGTPIASGVGIGGQLGQAVNAAAAGRVVYAGSGLIGYGQLIIIKHNETFLSAYGHNSRVLVSQGQSVGRGQKIAEMGYGPGRQPRLHFEIRRNGVPIDPMPQLRSAG